MSITPLAQARKIKHSLDYSYSLYDRFSTDVSAGSVNGTLADVGGARTVTDTESKLSISGGVAVFTPRASPTAGDPGLWYPIQSRLLGKALISTVIPSTTTLEFTIGFGAATNGRQSIAAFRFRGSGVLNVYGFGNSMDVATYTATQYSLVNIMRAAGSWSFIKGGAFTNWTMLYAHYIAADVNNLYPGASTVGATFLADNPRVSKSLYIPVPLQSDGMSAATTDGLGNPENNGTSGNTYTDIGTWGVTGGKRSCSALTGAGFSYLACSSSNVIIDAVCTRSAGVAGLVGRYADASNYLIAYIDGTNAKLDRVVAGVTTNLISGAVTYGATKNLTLQLSGTSARLYYDNIIVGTVATTPAAGSLNHGVYTTDTGATFDNLVIWAKGNESQYVELDLL